MCPDDDDQLLFADESPSPAADAARQQAWKVIIADDEKEVHTVTEMVLSDYQFEGRTLMFLNTYSGEETRRLIEEHPDTAILLLDVVMESKDSGLEVVRYIRDHLENRFVRIILRTGQPGEAPENEVITKYDINDYKEKTELTSQKLFTTVTAALRAYRDIRVIEKSRRGLEQIIESSARLFELQSLKKFARGALTQLISILGLGETSVYFQVDGFTALQEGEEFVILAATGQFEPFIGRSVMAVVPDDIRSRISNAISKEHCQFDGSTFVGYFPTKNGSRNMLYISGWRDMTEMDKNLIRVFSTNLAIAFDNIHLNREIVETQKEVMFTLGEVVETRSHETANHVRRVAEMSFILARKAGLDEQEARLIYRASPMHDIGKVGIPDSILLKGGPLTSDEFEIMKTHVTIGYNILRNSKREILRTAAIIALQHHERWDGNGYVQGLEGEEIHIYGRITTLADIFDALSKRRVYKDPWPTERVVDYIRQERGLIFDPDLTDVFLDNIETFIAIRNRFRDK
ncbi:hypothetical protein DENIS_2673 [Desulfonema ishimotonii]|uniref:DUF3369 domain-containing protein n=2 Tax=Desulfonema ishimotonii TaxID=45657 RepID=A0A401FXM2_9BACT|nr:hypothetical protein DENIS_2673 [Desulfonema ishimotonii]